MAVYGFLRNDEQKNAVLLVRVETSREYQATFPGKLSLYLFFVE